MSSKIELTISQNEVIADLQAADNVAVLNQIIQAARSAVAAGGTFVLEETCDNSPSTIIVTYDTLDGLEAWVDDMNELRATLGQSRLGS